MSPWIYRVVIILSGISVVLCSWAGDARAQACEQWVAKAVSIQGGVQSLRVGEIQWRPVGLNDLLCPGDMIRILKLSRADIVLSNNSILRLDQNTTVTFSKQEEENTFPIKLFNGAAYFFSRIRRSLKLFTPFVNAIIEGTEFYARVESDRATITLFEGRVALTNQEGTLMLARGQTAVAAANRAPVLYTVVRPRDAVQWTLYYPPVLYYRPDEFQTSAGEWGSLVRKSIGFYMEGDLAQALATVEQAPEEIRDPRFYTYRASLLLSVGRVDDARAEIGKARQLIPENSQALGLEAVIAVAQNDKGKALGLAKKAIEADPRSASARIALSYALQASFDLQGALAALKEAVKLEPENALAWARLAELWLSFGELKEALKAANRAVNINPNLARTQTVLGFAYLMQIETKRSKDAFLKAITLDQADPLPRLGLGLATIRDGDLSEGRGEIEIAASLDPDNSLIRSYLGKAYYEEKREKLASSQFELAKELDPMDPTPFFYDAILKQSVNQPVDALRDLQKSISLNDNRAVYRSRLLLDSDLAARSASLARIYSDLDFQQLALAEGWKSVNVDPANYSAHRFLADSYSALPRHEIARVSELLQSQLLQPANITPVQPRLAEANLFLLEGAGPSNPSFNEFNPLFYRNRSNLQMSGVAGGQSTFGDEAVLSGVLNKLSYSLGQFHYETDGFRENNDLKLDIYNAFMQASLSPTTSIQGELRATDSRKGDRELTFFDSFIPTLRQEEEVRSVRLGAHHAFRPGSEVMASFIYKSAEIDTNVIPGFFELSSDFDFYGSEVRYLYSSEFLDVTGGAGYRRLNEKLQTTLMGTLAEENSKFNYTNAYLYSQIKLHRTLKLTAGVSADFLEGGFEGEDHNQVNPKFGLLWNPFSTTTVRAAIFRTLQRPFISREDIDPTLEPTQVAGFNQFFFGPRGESAWNYGVGIDQKVTKSLFAGAALSYRDIESSLIDLSGPSPVVRRPDWEEWFLRSYLYWTPFPFLALSAEYLYERFEREPAGPLGFTGAEEFSELKTHRVPLAIRYFHPWGFIGKLGATYVDQSGRFTVASPMGATLVPGDDQFWVWDASIGYRLPKRYGIMSLSVKNLQDRRFHFQDTDPGNPRIFPGRLILFRFTASF